jgi:CPA2 family monovalent cation:H+ antiporter-2
MTEAFFFQDLAVLMVAAGVMAAIFTRLGWPKVIGYIAVGILMSKHTWGGSLLADESTVSTIGQLGIVFLMLTLGLEFSADAMRKIRHVTVPTALFDTTMMIWLGYTVGRRLLGWGSVSSLFLGAAICDSATTLLAKTIDEMKWSRRPFVRYIFGTTIFEDILCIGVIALVTGVANGKGMSLNAVGLSLGGLMVFLIGVVVFGLVLVPRFLNRIGLMRDDETLLLALLGCCFLVSFIASRLDFSLALGAFLVGVLGTGTEVRERILRLVAPLRSMFAAVFFVAIGLLVNPVVCWHHLPAILGLTALVVVGKAFNCFTLSIMAGQRVKDAVQTGLGLAQIGEFAYMVALLYTSSTSDSECPIYQIVVGVSLITTCLNPALLRLSDPAGDWLENHLPARVRGWLSAYSDWLTRFRAAQMPSTLQRHIRSRLTWLAVIAVLNVAVSFAAARLEELDYSRFSSFFEAHKRVFFCLLANLFCVSMLAPIAGLGRSLGHVVGTVLIGTRQPRRWRASVVGLVTWFVLAAVLGLATAQILMININLLPDELLMRWGVVIVLVAVTILGWKRFAQAGRRAGRRFNEALAAEKHRSSANVATTLSVPGDFYNRIPVTASAVVGRTIRELDIRVKTGALIVSVTRQGEKVRNPGPTWAFAADDEVMAIGEPAQLAALRALLSK